MHTHWKKTKSTLSNTLTVVISECVISDARLPQTLLSWTSFIFVNRKTLIKKHNHYRAQSPLIQRGKHQPFLRSVFRENMRELCFLKLKSGIIKTRQLRMVPRITWPSLSSGGKWKKRDWPRETVWIGLSRFSLLYSLTWRVVTKQGGLLNWDTINLSFQTSSE